jgi:hypothetical protein
MIYNGFIDNKNPSPSGEGLVIFTQRRRGWVSSQQLISSPKAAEVELTADLINLVIDL